MRDVDLIEKLTRFVRSLYECIRDWEFRHPWIARPFWYFALLVVVLGVCHWAFDYFDLYHTYADSARYMLSAMVQAQAAIIAIVITLTLIAVQLTASAYSPRVICVFKKNPDMWLLLGFYGLSMLYGLVVLKMVVGGAGEVVSPDVFWSLGCVSISLESCVSFAYWLEAFTLVALFPYMLNIIGLLKSENIIKRLAIEITKDKILNPKKDPIQPIMDIIHGAVMKYDIATVGCGIDAVTEKAVTDLYKDLDNENISAHFCGHLGRAGRYAVHTGEDESAIEIIGCLEYIGTSTIMLHYGNASKISAQYIEMIGTFAAEKRLRVVTCAALASLEEVGTLTAEHGLGDSALQSINSLGNVGMYAADNKIGIAAQDAAKYLGLVGKCAAENELKNAALQAADSIGVVGNYAADNKLQYATSQAAKSLGLVGRVAAEKELGDVAKQAVESLGLLGRISAENGLEDAAWQTVPRLGSIGRVAAEKGLVDAAERAASHLGRIGGVAAVNRFERVAKETAKSLGSIGKVAVEGKIVKRSVVMQAIKSLGRVGEIAAEEELKDTTFEATTHLGLVGGVAAANRFGRVTQEAIERLRRVGEIATEQGLNDATFGAASRFISIGRVATEKGLDSAAHRAAECLAELTISSKDIVGNAIELSGHAFEERNQKFLNLYEQQLKELRTRNSN